MPFSYICTDFHNLRIPAILAVYNDVKETL